MKSFSWYCIITLITLLYVSTTYANRLTIMDKGIVFETYHGAFWRFSLQCTIMGVNVGFTKSDDPLSSHWVEASTIWIDPSTQSQTIARSITFKQHIAPNTITIYMNNIPEGGVPSGIDDVKSSSVVYLAFKDTYIPLLSHDDVICYHKGDEDFEWKQIQFEYYNIDAGFTDFGVSLVEQHDERQQRWAYRSLDALTVGGLLHDIGPDNPLLFTVSFFDDRVLDKAFAITRTHELSCIYNRSSHVSVIRSPKGPDFMFVPQEVVPKGHPFTVRCKGLLFGLEKEHKSYWNNKNSIRFGFGYIQHDYYDEHIERTFFVYEGVSPSNLSHD